MSNDNPFRIRPATPADMPLILSFIRELAEYERLLHEVVADESSLAETLFGESPSARVVIGEQDGKPAGFALFHEMYSTFIARPGIYLEDLFVRPEFRGLGMGKALLVHLAAMATGKGYCRLDWSVLTWNDQAIRFYESIGARELDDWTRFRLDGEALQELAKV